MTLKTLLVSDSQRRYKQGVDKLMWIDRLDIRRCIGRTNFTETVFFSILSLFFALGVGNETLST